MAAKAEKWNLPLVEKQRIWYNILHDAPSPSGKAGDFDSPIVGSTPAGAIYAGVAQWSELIFCKYRADMDLAGSNPVSSSISSIILFIFNSFLISKKK